MIYSHKDHEIEIFDSIQNLPILRFQKFNKYQMQSVEIGNSFEDYDNRTLKIIQFLKKDMKSDAIKELENRRQSYWNAMNEFTPKGKSFAVLVKRIDDVKYDLFAPDDLDRCLEHLNRIGFDIESSMTKLKEVKKKIEAELVVYYPKYFPKNGNIEHTILRVKRMNAMLDGLIESKDNEKHIFDIEKDILKEDKPNVWNIHQEDNMERTLEVDFHKFAIAVTEKTGQKISEIMTFTFYATVEYLTDKNRKK